MAFASVVVYQAFFHHSYSFSGCTIDNLILKEKLEKITSLQRAALG